MLTGDGGGRGWARSRIIRPQERLVPYKSFNTLCVRGKFNVNSLGRIRPLIISRFTRSGGFSKFWFQLFYAKQQDICWLKLENAPSITNPHGEKTAWFLTLHSDFPDSKHCVFNKDNNYAKAKILPFVFAEFGFFLYKDCDFASSCGKSVHLTFAFKTCALCFLHILWPR